MMAFVGARVRVIVGHYPTDGGDLGSRAQAVDAGNEFLNSSPVS